MDSSTCDKLVMAVEEEEPGNILSVSEIEPVIVKKLCTLDPNYVLCVLAEFLNKVQATREARDAITLAESKQIVNDLVQSLMEIAFQALRTVPWTTTALNSMTKLRREIDLFDNWNYYYDYLATQMSGGYYPGGLQAMQIINGEPPYSFMTLFNPEKDLYNTYIAKLNDLIKHFNHFNLEPKITVAIQVIEIGRTATSMASILFRILRSDDQCCRWLSILSCMFSRHVLLKPVLTEVGLICNQCIDNNDMEGLWKHLVEVRGYTDDELNATRGYSVISVNDPLDPQFQCAFAILNHDVTAPFPEPSDDTPIDKCHPMVYLQHLEVRKEYMRCGIATFLMRFIKKSAKENGYECISIFESDLMLETERFWKIMGFKPSKYVPGWHEIEFE